MNELTTLELLLLSISIRDTMEEHKMERLGIITRVIEAKIDKEIKLRGKDEIIKAYDDLARIDPEWAPTINALKEMIDAAFRVKEAMKNL